MALGPKEASQVVAEEILRQVAEEEKKIDEMMTREYSGDESYTCCVSDKLHPKAIKELIVRYKKAGWARVESRSNQKDGAYLDFWATNRREVDSSEWGGG